MTPACAATDASLSDFTAYRSASASLYPPDQGLARPAAATRLVAYEGDKVTTSQLVWPRLPLCSFQCLQRRS